MSGHVRRRPSIREVAQRAGVAVSSVSRVLSQHPDVSEAMRDRVQVAADELGYQPDMLAQSLRRNETRSIGIVLGDISNPLMASIVGGAETTLSLAGYSTLLTNSLGDPALDIRNIRLFQRRRVDGLMLLTVKERGKELTEELTGLAAPVVAIERALPAAVGASRVTSDHRTGMREAVGHLLDLGHRRIALINGQRVLPSRERQLGLEDAYASQGLPQTYLVRAGTYAEDHGMSAMNGLLDLDEAPTAVIAGSNQITVGALRVLHERNVKLGRDMSFVACDDQPVTELHDPPIAVIARDPVAIGVASAHLVLERLREAGAPAREENLPTWFIPRASCAAPASMAQPTQASGGKR